MAYFLVPGARNPAPGTRYVNTYGYRCGRESQALASSSLWKRSAREPSAASRPARIAMWCSRQAEQDAVTDLDRRER